MVAAAEAGGRQQVVDKSVAILFCAMIWYWRFDSLTKQHSGDVVAGLHHYSLILGCSLGGGLGLGDKPKQLHSRCRWTQTSVPWGH